MKAGSWASLVHIYLYGVVSAASLSKVIPLHDSIGTIPGATPQSFALFISLLAVPPAILGTMAGGIIDRIGARSALVMASLAGALANGLYLIASSMTEFFLIRLLEGLAPLGVYAAAPALLISTSAPTRRDKAMSLWSTYTPTGVSLGLIIAAACTAYGQWRYSFAVHGTIFLVLALAAAFLPTPARAGATGTPSRSSVLAVLSTRDGAGPLRLASTVGTLILLGFGMSIVFPQWFSRMHEMSVSRASGILAAANIVTILGGTLTAMLLARGARAPVLFVRLAIAGSVASAGIFAPGLATALSLCALLLWLVATGGAMAVAAATLPHVAEPGRRASTAGLLSQTGAIVTFVTPTVWLPVLAREQWLLLVAVVVIGWFASAVLLPRAPNRVEI